MLRSEYTQISQVHSLIRTVRVRKLPRLHFYFLLAYGEFTELSAFGERNHMSELSSRELAQIAKRNRVTLHLICMHDRA